VHPTVQRRGRGAVAGRAEQLDRRHENGVVEPLVHLDKVTAGRTGREKQPREQVVGGRRPEIPVAASGADLLHEVPGKTMRLLDRVTPRSGFHHQVRSA
jgi:hypothetical protein